METKLTLRLDEKLIGQAKKEARKRGTSLSKMVGDYLRWIESPNNASKPLPPLTASLLGSLRGRRTERGEYHRYLEEKYR